MHEYEPTTREELRSLAIGVSCEAIFATDWQLFLDLDDHQAIVRYGKNIAMLKDVAGQQGYFVREAMRWNSRSGRGMHVVLNIEPALPGLDPLPLPTRLLWQSVLGSDPARDLASYREWAQDYEAPVTLFRPMGAVVYDGEGRVLGGARIDSTISREEAIAALLSDDSKLPF